jgi:hypothetical protein
MRITAMPTEIKSALNRLDQRIENWHVLGIKALLALNSYRVFAIIMLILAAAIDVNPDNRLLDWIGSYTNLLYPATWKYLFLLSAGCLWIIHPIKYQQAMLVFAFPLVWMMYYVLRAIEHNTDFVAGGTFSAALTGSMILIIVVYGLRTGLVNHLWAENALLRHEVDTLKAPPPSEALPDGK